MNKKEFTNIIILIVVMVVAVSVGSYIFLNRQSLVKNPISTSTPISNVNVNNPAPGITFREKQYRFELTLPQQWTGIETQKNDFLDGSAISFILKKKEFKYTLFTILVSSKQEWMKEKEKFPKNVSVSVIAERDGNIYAYVINPADHPDDYTDSRFAAEERQIKELKSQIINTIIPTFKFINVSSSVSDWKTYSDNEFGFEFKYPSTWKISKSPILDGNGWVVASNNGYLMIEIGSNNTLEQCTLGGGIYSESERLIYKQYARDIIVSGITGKEIIGKDVAPKYTGRITLGILKNGICYRISLDGRDSDDDVQGIVSTFKFTK